MKMGLASVPLGVWICLTLGTFGGEVYAGSMQGEGSRPELRLVTPDSKTDGDVAVEVVGLGERLLTILAQTSLEQGRWNDGFAVYVRLTEAPRHSDPIPILGTHDVVGDTLRFVPRFPFVPGLEYWAELHTGGLIGLVEGEHRVHLSEPTVDLELDFLIPKPEAPATVVEHVYPSGEELPENLLKFYLHFSAAMSQGRSYDFIHLLDENGDEVELPFLELSQELWDPAGLRLTLLLDPGRIKSGLVPRQEAGLALEEGGSFTLLIDRDWPDAWGNPLQVEHRKVFRVGPWDRTPPDLDSWELVPPSAGTREPLVLRLPEPLDHALLGRLVWVLDAAGEVVPGKPEVLERETRWALRPDAPWSAGRYHLAVMAIVEDLAGNRVDRPFEIDLRSSAAPTEPGERVLKRKFYVR